MRATYLLIMRCPVYRRRESQLGFRMELENLIEDAKGKRTSGRNRKAENTDASIRGGLPRSSVEAPAIGVERRGWVIQSGLGQLERGGAFISGERRRSFRDGTSRMTRECQVRISERLEV